MITEQDLKSAIAECQGVRNPNAETCIKLAAFYTIYDHLYPQKEISMEEPKYSYKAPSENIETVVDYYSDTEFGRMIEGQKSFEMWELMDELMSTIQVLNEPLYKSVLRKIDF